MNRRFSFLAAAAVVALALSAPAHAGTVNVYSDSGGGSADVTGTAGGVSISTAAYANDVINTINSGSISPALSLSVTMSLTGSGGVITTGTGTKVIDGTTITYTMLTGIYTKTAIALDGVITAVSGSTPGYNFAPLVGGDISVVYTDASANFTKVFDHTGVKVTAAGVGVTELSAVPEPASIALLGIGMTGLLAIRRLLKRSKA